jgi:hypothetical protein
MRVAIFQSAGCRVMAMHGATDSEAALCASEHAARFVDMTGRRGFRHIPTAVPLLAFSHCSTTAQASPAVRGDTSPASGREVATGERFALRSERPGWWRLELPLHPRQGRYVLLS